jgi:hypothetical protein
MEIIRKITKEITEIRTRMVPEKYEETKMQDCIVVEFTAKELKDLYLCRYEYRRTKQGEWAKNRYEDIFKEIFTKLHR